MIWARARRTIHACTGIPSMLNPLRGEPDPRTGWLRDLARSKPRSKAFERARSRLLNEVEGLGNPTLENLVRVLAVLRWTDFLSPPRGQARGPSAAIRALRPQTVEGFPPIPTPKTFLLPMAAPPPFRAPKPRRCRQRHSRLWLGAPLVPDGDPMVDGVGPAANAMRADTAAPHLRGRQPARPMRAGGEKGRHSPIRAAWPCSARRPCCRRHRFRHLDRPFRNGYSLP